MPTTECIIGLRLGESVEYINILKISFLYQLEKTIDLFISLSLKYDEKCPLITNLRKTLLKAKC